MPSTPKTDIQPPWVLIPGFPDYAIHLDEGRVMRVTPYWNHFEDTNRDGTMSRDKWREVNAFCLTENARGQVSLVPRGGKRGLKRSIASILKEIEEGAP